MSYMSTKKKVKFSVFVRARIDAGKRGEHLTKSRFRNIIRDNRDYTEEVIGPKGEMIERPAKRTQSQAVRFAGFLI